jgi:hypothetical protein
MTFYKTKVNILRGVVIFAVYLCLSHGVYASIRSDVNQDANVSTVDAQLTLRDSVGLGMNLTSWTETTITGDVNCDGSNTSVDAQLIMRKSLGFNMTSTDWCDKLKAFAGAEGGGAQAQGGRGGIVYEVTNLDDSGEGSLRYGLLDAAYKNVPRTIVFKVGGYIHLQNAILVMNDSFITIAGQTAPGDGITIVSPSNPDDGVIEFRNVHDVIMRYVSIRKGGAPPEDYRQQGSNFSIIGDSHDIILDHCSIGWAGDENFGMFNVHPGGEIVPNKITFQWSISSENLRRATTVDGRFTDSTGFFVGSSTNPETSVDVSVHHNLFARNNNRNPNFKGGSGDIVANIIYNWHWYATAVRGGVIVDVMDNVFKAGPARYGGDRRPEITFIPAQEGNPATGVFRDLSMYMDGNIGYHNADPTQDAWDTMMHHAEDDFSYLNGDVTPVSRDYQRMQKRALTFPITRENALTLDNTLLTADGVGNSRRLSADGSWVNNRDLVDTRVINDYENTTGDTLVSSVDMVGGWPYWDTDHYAYTTEEEFIAHPELYKLQGGTAYQDSDHDGMPDLWEDNNGLNKYDNSDGAIDSNNSGYTNLEEFLNGGSSTIVYPEETTFTEIPTDTTTPYPDYMASVTDATFGSKITRLSDYNTHWGSLSYPKTQDWNQNMNFIILNYKVIDTSDWHSLGLIDGQFFDYRWSSVDPRVLYGLKHLYNDDDEVGGFEDDFVFKKMTINPDSTFHYDDLITFSHNDYEWIYTGPGEGNIDFNDKYVVFAAKKIGEDYLTAILYDIENDIATTYDFTDIHWGDNPYTPGLTDVDWISVSPLGNYILINWRPDSDGGIYQYDLDFNLIRQLTQSSGHGDMGVTADNKEVFLEYEYGARRGIWQYDLETGEETKVLPDKYNGGHVSCRNHRRRGWCYLSTTQEGYREVFALKLDHSGTVNRFVQTRITAGNAQGSVSPDGTKVLFKSEWDNHTAELDGTHVDEVFMAEVYQ